MKKVYSIVIISLLLLFVGSTQNCQAGMNSLKYLGTAFVKITTSEGKVIYIDPYAVNQSDSADIVLITHEHSDHNELTRIIQKSDCRLIRPVDAIKDSVYQTFTIGNIKITSVPAYNQYHPKYEGVGYIVEFDSIKVYHAGGTGKIPEMANLATQNITYALFPITPGPEEMTQAAQMVQARHNIPIHSIISTTQAFVLSLAGRYKPANRIIVFPNETIQLTSDASYSGKTLRVPQEYSTIQSAINAAQNNDTIIVSEGTYTENIRYNGKSIVLTSMYFATKDWQTVRNTILDGSTCVNKDTASTVQFLIGEDSTTVLDGFTIIGGTGTKYLFPYGNGAAPYQEGAGIVMHYSSAIIKNNIIRNNTMVPQPGVSNGGGGGIASMYGNPTIINNTILSNNAGYAGGIVLNWSGGKIRNNIVYHNTAGSPYGGGGIMVWKVPKNSAFVENNTIVGNTSQAKAGGIILNLADGSSIPVIANNIVYGNKQASGSQFELAQYGTYNNVEDYSSGTNFSTYAEMMDSSFQLSSSSPCIDAGDPAIGYNDPEDPGNAGKALLPSKGSVRNDIGAFGGASTYSLPSFIIHDIKTSRNTISLSCTTGQQTSAGLALFNMSSRRFLIDSVSLSNGSAFSTSKNYAGQSVNLFRSDSIIVLFQPTMNGTYYDTIRIFHGSVGVTNPMLITVTGTSSGGSTDVQQEKLINHKFQLFQNFPNPFNPSTEIKFSVETFGDTSLRIYDILGKEVATLVNERKPAGSYQVTWNASAYSSGVYFCKLTTGERCQTRKLLLFK